METLNFNPDYNASKELLPKLVDITFGDGYNQARPKGLSHNLATFSLTFSGNIAKIKQIDDFLTHHGGYKTFLWTPPFGKQGKYKCKKHKVTYQQAYGQLTGDFEEVVA